MSRCVHFYMGGTECNMQVGRAAGAISIRVCYETLKRESVGSCQGEAVITSMTAPPNLHPIPHPRDPSTVSTSLQLLEYPEVMEQCAQTQCFPLLQL